MKYVVLSNATDYRTIARIMTENGQEMNHATARNVLHSGLFNLLNGLSEELHLNLSKSKIREMIKNPNIQEAIAEILSSAYQEEKESENLKTKESFTNAIE